MSSLVAESLSAREPERQPLRFADLAKFSSAADRRVHRRLTPQQIAWLKEARIKYGASVSVLDMSIGGALIETEMQLRPGSSAVLEIIGDSGESLVPFRVLRCHVASLAGHLRYRGACEFKHPFLTLSSSLEEAAAADAAAIDLPAIDLAKLDRALRRAVDQYLSWAGNRSSRIIRATDNSEPTCPEDTIRVLQMISAEAGRRSSDVLSRALYGLLVEVMPMLRMGKRARFQAARVEEHLRKMLPMLTIRLQSGEPLMYSPAVESIFFAIGDQEPAPEILHVEFSATLVVEPWQFSLLKCGAALINLLRRWELDEADVNSAAAAPVTPTTAEAALAGWHKVIARHVDGNVMKGYTQDFNASRNTLHLNPSPQSDVKEQKVVQLSRLKAVFLVREFEGDAGYSDKKEFAGPVLGRRIEVTFVDGEVILGSLLAHRPERQGPGFFIKPADPQSNNIRIFVVADAVRHVRFP